MTLVTIIIYLLILAVLVILHELGHFLVAKWFKVRVDEFGIGFPPRICQLFRWKGTDFVLNWIPVGGYVSLAGENAPADAEVETETPDDVAGQELFYQKQASQRFLVILAGPVMNVLLAMVIFMLAYGIWGIPREIDGQVYVSYVEPDSPAAQAGIPLDARLVSITDSSGSAVTVEKVDIALEFLAVRHGSQVILEIDETCKSGVCPGPTATYAAVMRPDDQIPAGGGSLGVAFTSYIDYFYPWYQHIPLSIYYGCRQSLMMTWEMIAGLWTAAKELFVPGPKEVMLVGPVGIVTELTRQQTFQQGLMSILGFAGLLSLNLGIVNLLPIPAVDGGRLVLIVAEKFVGRERVAKIEAALNYAGFILIAILMIAITGSDIWRLVTGG